MDLTDTQKAAVTAWVEAGADLGQIQTRLKDEFELNLTYLDTRFLLGDLGLELHSESEDSKTEQEEASSAPEAETPPPDDSVDPVETPEETPPDADETPLIGGKVTVTVDSIAQPHAIVSGKVNFSDGESAGWYLDQMGRLGLDPSTPDYKPSEEDIAAFQMELQNVLRNQGF